MPILDLQDDQSEFTEAGRIRLGVREKKKNDRGEEIEVTKELPCFVLADAPDLIPHYGTEPTELLIYLPYATIPQVFRAYYELFGQGGLYCQGDGEHLVWALDPNKTGQVVVRNGMVVAPYVEQDGRQYAGGEQAVCPGQYHDDPARQPYPRCAECDPRGLLFIIVRDPKDPVHFVNRRLAYYRISTGSVRNIVGLTRNLNGLAQLTGSLKHGLSGIPMILRRVPGASSFTTDSKQHPGTKTRAKTTHYYLHIEPDPHWAEYGALAMAAQALDRPVQDLLALPDVTGESNGDDIVDAEEVSPGGDDLYVPPSLKNLDTTIQTQVDALEAMRGSVPLNWGGFHSIMLQYAGAGYKSDVMLRSIRERLVMGRTEKMELNPQTWNASIDLMIEHLSGQAPASR